MTTPGHLESQLPHIDFSVRGIGVFVAVTLPPLIVKEAVLVDLGRIERPRLTLLMRNGHLFCRFEADKSTHTEIRGPQLQTVIQSGPQAPQKLFCQVTKAPSKLQLWLNGTLRGEEILVQQPRVMTGATRVLASFEGDLPAAGITIGAHAITNQMTDAEIKALVGRIARAMG